MSRENIEAVCKLSPLQEGLLFHAVRDPESLAYVNQHTVTLEGQLDWDLFQKAWREVTTRHQILRSSFHWEGVSWPVQVIHKHAEPNQIFIDLREYSSSERYERYLLLAKEQRKQGFALSKAPLFRIALVRLDDELYSLCWTHHHLILDGWSSAIVARDLFAIYESLRLGRQPDLPPAGAFSNFLQWVQKQQLTGAREYWSRVLEGFSEPTALPYLGLGSPGGQGYHQVARSLEPSENSRVRRILRSQGFTLSTLINAAWSITLMRHSHNDSVMYGVTTSGRPPELPAIEHTAGLFINTLPFRVKALPRDTARTLMQRIQDQMVDLQTFEHTPLAQVQKWSGADNANSLFECLMVVETYPITSLAKSGLNTLRVREIQLSEHTTYPLSITIETDGLLTAKFTYDRRCFCEDHIRRLIDEFLSLVIDIANLPDRSLTDLMSISAFEQARVLQLSRGPNIGAAQFIPVHQDFIAQARSHPERIAVVCGADSVTYQDLDRWSDAIAVQLLESGVEPEDPVVVIDEDSIETIAAILGILKSGGACAPIDPAAAHRVVDIIQSTGSRIIYSASAIVGSPVPVLRIERNRRASAGLRLPIIFPEAVAYLINTCGSAGQSKGIAVSHANLFYSNRGRKEFYQEEVGTFLLLPPLFFDGSVAGLLWTFTTGGTLVLPATDSRLNVLGILHEIAQRKVTHLMGSPLFYRELLDEAQGSETLTILRTAIITGEACAPSLAAKHFALNPNARLFNEYCPPEATACCTAFEISPDTASISIGRPMAGTSTVLLDVDGQLVPEFATGELYIGGTSVARGYWRCPDLTAAHFLPDPFSDIPGKRIYRTGCLARWQDGGTLLLMGQSERQAKIRGHRVQPGEVEAAILIHPSVRDCVVVPERISGDLTLVAYVAGDEGIESEVAESLPTKLPAYLLPGRIVRVADLPRTVTGTVDYGALSPNADQPTFNSIVQERPRTPTEQMIAGIWTDVLGVEFIGREQNFFDLGGHSIHALRVIGRIRSRFAIDIPLNEMFALPTIAGLAARIDQTSRRTDEIKPIEQVLRDRNLFPLSFAQERMWLLHRLSPESSAYNIPIAIEIEGPLDVSYLESSLTMILERHEILRSVIVEHGGDVGQQVWPSSPVSIPVVDLTDLTDSEADEQERRVAQEEAGRPFTLSVAPLLRICLVRRSTTQHTLYLTIHHIAADEWSMRVLLRETTEIYAAQASGQQLRLAHLPVQYIDYAAWQRRSTENGALRQHIDYWVSNLKNAPMLVSLLPDKSCPTERTHHAGVVSTRLSPETAAKLRAFARREGLTPFMVLLAIFGVTLARWNAKEEFCIGTPSDDRIKGELDALIGLFVNTLVLRVNTTGNPDFNEMLRHVKKLMIKAHEHRDAPFDAVVEALRPARIRERNPLFQVMFAYGEEIVTDSVQAGDLTLRARSTPIREAKFDLTLSASETDVATELNWEFSVELFERETIERVATVYNKLLDACLESPHMRIQEVALMDIVEQRILLDWGKGPATPCVAEASIPSIIREQALRSPTAAALQYEGHTWTYEDLIREADTVAAHLIKLGLKSGDIACICLPRSADAIAVMLGILTVGAAYMPLASDDMPSHITSFAESANAKMLITRADIARTLTSSQIRIVEQEELRIAHYSVAVSHTFGPVAGSLAYVMHVSGTSSAPKGVMVPHSAVLGLAFGLEPIIDLSSQSCVLHATSLAFNASIFEIWATLLRGGSIIIAPGTLTDFHSLCQIIESAKVDTIWLTSETFNEIVDLNLASLENVQQLLIGGETLSVDHVRRYREKYRTNTLVNGYGSTESNIFTCCHLVPAVVPHDIPSIPIGRPIGGSRLYVLDDLLNPVPIGAEGELYATGEGLAFGYEANPVITAERFVPDPFSNKAGSRMYKTGARTRWRSDGSLEYLGRLNRQTEIPERQIEQNEVEHLLRLYTDVRDDAAKVEHLLRLHPGIRNAAVKVVKGHNGRLSLVGYFIPIEGFSSSSDELRKWLQDRAPRHMIPSIIIPIASLPRTASGKVDYNSLPDVPEVQEREAGGEARTEIERQLIDIWRVALRLDSLGVHDNFFMSGGDSLLALRVCARAVEAGLSVTLNDMFSHQTAARLATVIETRGVFHKTDDETGPVPLNASQQFFLESNSASPDHFNISSFLEVRTKLSDSQWREVVAAVRNNHDSLRLRITDIDGQWSAEVLDCSDIVAFARVDLRGLQREEQDRRMREESQQWQTRLSIRDARLFQLVLFELGPERYDRLLAIVHHLAADGSSVPILLESLERAVRGLKNNHELRLQKPACSWRYWVSTLKGLTTSPEVMQDMIYWVRPERMKLYPLPRDHQGENLEHTTSEIISDLNTAETTRVLEAARKLGSSIAEAVLSAVVAGVGEWAHTPFLNIDWIAHGRESIRPDLEVSGTTGYFSLRVPTVIENRPGESAAGLLPSICESIRRLPHGGLSYGMLRYLHEDLTVQRAMSRTPQPEMSFNYLGDFDLLRPATQFIMPLDISAGVARAGSHRRPCLIQVFASIERRTLRLLWRYSTAIHDQTTIERLAKRTIKALQDLASTPSQTETQHVSILRQA